MAVKAIFPAFLLLFFKETAAQETDTIDQVVVTGQFRPQPADNSIYDIKVIGDRDIRLKAANTLGELLKNEAGFQMRSGGVLGDYVRIRGLSGEHVKILIDGMPVTGRVADMIDLGQLTLQTVDHVEIIEGPMSVVYGSNALAGAINIITRDYADSKLHFSAGGYYESSGTYNLNASAAKKIKHHTISVNAARNFFDGWGPVDTSRYMAWKPKLQYTAGLGYNYARKNLRINFNGDFLDEELRDPGALTLANLYEKAIDGHHYTTRLNNRINILNTFRDDFTLNFQAGHSFYRKRKISYLNDLVNLEKTVARDPNLHDTTLFQMISTRGFISNIPGEQFEYQTGFDMNFESGLGKRTGGYRQIYDISAFMNFIIRPMADLSFQPGIRVMHNSNYKAPLIYGFSLKYDPSPFTLKASYARGFRAPSLKQLYLEFVDNNHEIHGNEELKPETADNISVSATYSIFRDRKNLEVEAGFFYNSIHDAVQLAISTQNPGWGKYFNIQGSVYRTTGIEGGLIFRYSPGVTIHTEMIMTGRSKLAKEREYVWSADYTASLQWKIKKPDIQLALYYKYTDSYLEFAGNFNAEGKMEGIAQQLTSDYHSLDATLSRYFLKERFFVSAGFKNIFNVTLVNSPGSLNIHGNMDNAAAIGYGRSFFINLTYSLDRKP